MSAVDRMSLIERDRALERRAIRIAWQMAGAGTWEVSAKLEAESIAVVPASQLRGAVEALRDLADAVSIACGSRLTERDAALADKADAARRLVGGQ